eukprot:GHUV01036953.1.p1 GENE.GHUV01036953.1~~GHUV01036953.1.p1  ORF type:complete len:140 (-),score=28.92 GHUV01036953.1:365-784(-)
MSEAEVVESDLRDMNLVGCIDRKAVVIRADSFTQVLFVSCRQVIAGFCSDVSSFWRGSMFVWVVCFWTKVLCLLQCFLLLKRLPAAAALTTAAPATAPAQAQVLLSCVTAAGYCKAMCIRRCFTSTTCCLCRNLPLLST